MTPEELEVITGLIQPLDDKISECVTSCAVTGERLNTIEGHLDTQDERIESLQKRSWFSEGRSDLIYKIIPIAVASLVAGYFLKMFF